MAGKPAPSRPSGNGLRMHASSLPLPRPLLERLAAYHQIATQHGELGNVSIRSGHMAALLDIDPTLVRKDMAALGVVGRPKVGYPISALLPRLDHILGLTDRKNAILIGCGDLGSALARYGGFSKYGLQISALFDADEAKTGRTIAGLTVQPMEKCRRYIEIFRIEMAILAAPAACVQALADWLVARGVRAIWNFAPVHLKVPVGIVVRNENLALGLAQLLHEIKRTKAAPSLAEAPAPTGTRLESA